MNDIRVTGVQQLMCRRWYLVIRVRHQVQGVAFTRNPSTGEKGIYGEYLINAQGEDVVAGVRTPQPITQLENDLPDCYRQFIELAMKLEDHYADMQDMEFTIEEGKLYFLQTRNGKRTAQAAIQIACDLVDEGKITKEEAVLRIDAKSLDQLLHPTFDAEALKNGKVIGEALQHHLELRQVRYALMQMMPRQQEKVEEEKSYSCKT